MSMQLMCFKCGVEADDRLFDFALFITMQPYAGNFYAREARGCIVCQKDCGTSLWVPAPLGTEKRSSVSHVTADIIKDAGAPYVEAAKAETNEGTTDADAAEQTLFLEDADEAF